MVSDQLFKVTEEWAKNATVNRNEYENLYEESINNNIDFWDSQGHRIDWFKNYTKVKDVKYSSTDVFKSAPNSSCSIVGSI